MHSKSFHLFVCSPVLDEESMFHKIREILRLTRFEKLQEAILSVPTPFSLPA